MGDYNQAIIEFKRAEFVSIARQLCASSISVTKADLKEEKQAMNAGVNASGGGEGSGEFSNAQSNGSSALLQEVELMQLYDAVFSDLGLQGVVIHLNNRKVLSGIAEVIGAADKLIDFTVALDKLDKIGPEKVAAEMLDKGISQEAVHMAAPLFNLKGTNEAILDSLSSFLATSAVGLEGISEMAYVLKALSETNLSVCTLSISVTLARGLNYYTGTIIEVSAPEGVSMGSIGGGG